MFKCSFLINKINLVLFIFHYFKHIIHNEQAQLTLVDQNRTTSVKGIFHIDFRPIKIFTIYHWSIFNKVFCTNQSDAKISERSQI